MNGGADRAEGLAVFGLFFTAQNGAALTGLVVGHRLFNKPEFLFRIKPGVGRGNGKRTFGDFAKTAPAETLAPYKDLVHEGNGNGVAFRRYSPGKFVFHNAAPVVYLPHEHEDAQEHVKRLKPADHNRHMVVFGKPVIGLFADHGGNVRRAHQAVKMHFSQQDMFHGGRGEHVRADHRKVREVFFVRNFDCDRCRRRCRFKADCKEDNFLVGVFTRQFHRVHGGIHHADIRALRLRFKKGLAFSRRHTHHVGVGAENHAGPCGKLNRHVNAACGQNAHGATRSVNHFDVGGQKFRQSPAGQNMRVSAAKLHKAVTFVGFCLAPDFFCNGLRFFAVAKLSDVLHRLHPLKRPSEQASPALFGRQSSAGQTLRERSPSRRA